MKGIELKDQKIWIQILALLFTSHVILSKLSVSLSREW